MNKINLLFLLVIACIAISCNQNDDVKYVKQDYLKGVWKVSETGVTNNQGIVKYVGVTECDSTSYTFGEDKSFEEKNFNSDNGVCTGSQITGTYVLEDSKTLISYKNAAGKTLKHTKKLLSLNYEEMELVYTDSITQQFVYKKLLKK